MFSFHLAIPLINISVSFHGKHEVVWVTPHFLTVVYINTYNCCSIVYTLIKLIISTRIIIDVAILFFGGGIVLHYA